MLIRNRLIKGLGVTKDINWKVYIVELLVVFISIMAAFILNSWREASKDAQLEKKYLSSIYKEVLEDSENLKEVIDVNEKKLNTCRSYLLTIESDNMHLDSAIVLLGDMLSISSFYPKTGIYESMKFSGNLNLIEDYAVREKIVGYYESFDEYKLQQRISIDFIYDYVAKFVFDKMDLSNNSIMNKNNFELHQLNNMILAFNTFLSQNVKNQKIIYDKNVNLQNILRDNRN